MCYAPGPREFAGNTRALQLLTRAFRWLDDPRVEWIRKFMLCDDPAADLAVLTSPVQGAHGCTFSVCASSGTIDGNEFAYIVHHNYLLIPSFSVGEYSVGSASLHQVYFSPAGSGNSEPSAENAESLYDESTTGRFCLNNKTGELLLMLSPLASDADTLLDLLRAVVHRRVEVSVDVADAEKLRTRVRLEWWIQGPYSAENSNPEVVRESLWALCDLEMLLRGRYRDCYYLCEFSKQFKRTACGDCAKQQLEKKPDSDLLQHTTSSCSCACIYLCPEYPLDFSKLRSNIRVMSGSFSAAVEVVIRFPNNGTLVSFEMMQAMTMMVEANKHVAETLKERAASNALVLAKVPRLAHIGALQQLLKQHQHALFDAIASGTIDYGLMGELFSGASPWPASQNQETPAHGSESDATADFHSASMELSVVMPDSVHDYVSQRVNSPEEEREARMELRRQKNRAAAARSNARRKEEREYFQRSLKTAKDKLLKLRARETFLLRENARLRCAAREQGLLQYFAIRK